MFLLQNSKLFDQYRTIADPEGGGCLAHGMDKTFIEIVGERENIIFSSPQTRRGGFYVLVDHLPDSSLPFRAFFNLWSSTSSISLTRDQFHCLFVTYFTLEKSFEVSREGKELRLKMEAVDFN